MAKKGNRTWVWMAAEKDAQGKQASPHRFQTERNKKNQDGKLTFKRFCPVTKQHVTFVEVK
jgi:ribosomal protein L33